MFKTIITTFNTTTSIFAIYINHPNKKMNNTKNPPSYESGSYLSNQDGKTIAKKALFYNGFGHFCCCKFRFALLVFEPPTPM